MQFQLIAEGSRLVPGAGYRGTEDTGGLFTAPEIGRGVVADEPGPLNKQIALNNCGRIFSGILKHLSKQRCLFH